MKSERVCVDSFVFDDTIKVTGCSLAGLGRYLWEVEILGSNPSTPTKSTLSVVFIFIEVDVDKCYSC